MASLEELIAILTNQKDDKDTKWSPLWKGMLIVLIIFVVALFFESEKLSEQITISINEQSEKEEVVDIKAYKYQIKEKALFILEYINNFKKITGISYIQNNQRELITYLSDPIYIKINIPKNKELTYKKSIEKKNKLQTHTYNQDKSKLKQNVIKKYRSNNKIKPPLPIDPEYNHPKLEKLKKLTTYNNDKTIIKNKKLNRKIPETKKITSKKVIPPITEQPLVQVENQIDLYNKIHPPYNILLIGDSMLKGFVGSHILKKFTAIPKCKVYQKSVVSSGLAFSNHFDWIKKLETYVKLYDPNVLIVMIGTNDFHSLYVRDKKKLIKAGTKEWFEDYQKETERMMNAISKHHLLTFWIGLPVTEKRKLNNMIQKINQIHKLSSAKYKNIHYISTWDLFGNSKIVEKYIQNNKGRKHKIRARDGIHLGSYSANIVSNKVINTMSNYMIFN